MKSLSMFAVLASAVLLAACGSQSSLSGTGRGEAVSSPPTTRYDLAKGCYLLRAEDSIGFVASEADAYRADQPDQSKAMAFYLQPATLGRYLLLDANERLLSASGGEVQAAVQASDASIWTVDRFNAGFRLISESAGKVLVADDQGQLALAEPDESAGARFGFVGSTRRCATYPEMPTGIIGKAYKGRGVDQPIVGFADVHTHMGMSSEMSYAGDVGPSAGGVLYGEVIHRFGVAHALKDCAEFHGPDGIRDANNILATDPTGTHDTQGWPSFVDWPRRNYLTHQVMYYKWVERAWLAGLRIMVNHGTNIAALCRIGQSYALQPDADCDDMSVAVKQIRYLYDVQDYVDAQSGGPGQGWFRIVTSPQQAREVINDGKLAVVLGVEVAQVLDCGVTFLPDGSELRRCDEAQVEAEIDRLWDLGVRHIYPYHDIDSSLGGAGIFNGDVMNYLNYMDTGRFWETTSCRDYPQEEPSVREPGAEMATAIPGSGDDPLSLLLLEATSGLTPSYPPGKRCNARTVTDLGDFTLRKLMAKKMVIDIDHAAYHSKDIMLDIAEAQEPPYPLASSHDAHGGLTSDQAVRMLRSGGLIYPYKGNGSKHRDFLAKLEFWRDQAGVAQTQILGLGYGADANGFGGHPGPRGGDSEAVVYPFQLFSGPDWGNLFAAIEPLSVELLSIPQSGKFWHIDEVGMAHYGLVADFVEEVRLESGAEGLNALYSSAEAYVQMWERVYQRASMED